MAFSTDARDSADARDADRPGPDDTDRSESPDDAATDLDTTDNTDVREHDAAPDDELRQETAYDDSSLPPDDQADQAERTEPAPAPTAFGAATVGGAVAASAMADDRRDGERPDGDRADAVPATAVGVAEVPESGKIAPTDVAPTDTEPADTKPAEGEPAEGEPAEGEPAEGGELLPGAVPAAPGSALWDDATSQDFRARWREVQLRFVDDPEGATGEAQALVGEVVEALTAGLVEQRTELDGWRSGQGGDTEQLRVAIRRYRDFLDRLLGL